MSHSSRLLSALLFVFTAVNATPAVLLWEIGRRDQRADDLAFGPGQWRQIKEDALYVVGESDAKRDWPYVQPGPADGWGGNKPHTYAIVFGLTAPPRDGMCRLRCDLIDTQSRVGPKLRVTVNGTAFEQTLPAGGSDASLNGDPTKGRPQQFAIAFPAALLRAGDNSIQITTIAGEWLIYDWLGLEADTPATLARVAARTIVAEVQPVRVLVRRADALFQPVEVTLRHFGSDSAASIRIDGGAAVALPLVRGVNRTEILVPAVDRTRPAAVAVDVGQQRLATPPLTLPKVRQLTLYLVPHSHTDIGYTERQDAVERRQMQNLTDGIALANRTAGYPEGARFVWNVEVLWAADLYLHQMDDAGRAAFWRAVKNGQVALNGMYANELTGLCRPEELLRLFREAPRLAGTAGVPVETAMISDVPGYTWGVVTAMNQAGLRYLSAAPNYFDRIGDILVENQNRPFYWSSPSGRERALVWIPFRGYALSHIYHELSRHLLDDLQADLDRVGYPYDLTYTRWAGHGDNAAPDPAICDFVRDWNATYAWPRLVISAASAPFHALESRYGKQLPVRRGDWTPYWEDGAASSAFETALNRNASDRLSQAETLWALRKRGRYPAEKFDAAWRNVLLYSEHTWGASGSVWDPESPKTKEQWEVKRSFATAADEASKSLLAAAAGAPADSRLGAQAIDVTNTCSWARTDLVVVSAALSAGRDRVTDARGAAVDAQRLASGELAFVARDVPAFGGARFTLQAGTATCSLPAVHRDGGALDNGLVSVRIDPRTGAITDFRASSIARNLAGAGGLDDYLYLRGDDARAAEHNGPVTVSVGERGPLVASLVVTSTAPGCRALTREVRLVAGLDRVEFINTVDKERAPIAPVAGDWHFAQRGGKESVNFAFPFNVPGGDLTLDLPIGAMRPSQDQLPGACKNWFTVGRWIDVHNEADGVTCVTLDAPLIEVGGLTATLLGSQRDPSVWRKTVSPTQTFYSWVMNNHWGTNYRAYQEGPVVFRYVLRPHGRMEPAAATRLAIGVSQPLVATPADETRHPLPPALRLSNDGVVVTSLKPSDDGRAWIIRLYGASGKSETVRLDWLGAKPASVCLSDTGENKGAPIDGPITLAGWDVVTLRADW